MTESETKSRQAMTGHYKHNNQSLAHLKKSDD